MKILLIFVLFSSLIASPVLAKKLETVSPITIQSLRLNFNAANRQFQMPLYKKWNCKLYGVRSKTFTINKENFFEFSSKSKKVVDNNGVQVINHYKVFSRGLWGKKENIYENIRQLPDGRLITEISKPIKNKYSHSKLGGYASLAFSKHSVLAYGICQKNI